jgi:Spy/CpxP family protein refolding chaperone
MPRLIKIIMVIFSVCLNLAFVGMWAVHKLPCCQKGSPAKNNQGCNEGIWCPVYQKMGLSDAQWHQLEPSLLELMKSTSAISKELDRSRAELLALISSPQPDPDKIRACQEEILRGQQKIQDQVISCLLAQKKVLTPNQQKAFFKTMRESCCCGDQALLNGCGSANNCPSGKR